MPDKIEIVVSEPLNEEDAEGRPLHTTFLVTTFTNLPEYKSNKFSVRRRYSDFEYLRAHLVTQVSNNEKGNMRLLCIPSPLSRLTLLLVFLLCSNGSLSLCLAAILCFWLTIRDQTKGSLRRVPELPGKKMFGKFDKEFVEQRREGLEDFLNKCAGHAICRLEKGFHRFLEEQEFDAKTLPA